MNQIRDLFFTDTGISEDDDVAVIFGYVGDLAQHITHRPADTDKILQFSLLDQGAVVRRRRCLRALVLFRAFHLHHRGILKVIRQLSDQRDIKGFIVLQIALGVLDIQRFGN